MQFNTCASENSEKKERNIIKTIGFKIIMILSVIIVDNKMIMMNSSNSLNVFDYR